MLDTVVRKPGFLKSSRNDVWSVAFSHDGRFLASGGEDEAIRLWQMPQGRPCVNLVGHQDGVNALAFAPWGPLLASGGEDGLVKLWGPDRKELWVRAGHRGGVNALAFCPEFRLVISAGGEYNEPGEIIVWGAASGRALYRAWGHASEVLALAVTPQGGMLASGDCGGLVRTWRLAEDGIQPGISFQAHHGAVWTLAFHPDGAMLVSGGEDGRIKCWHASTGVEVGEVHSDSFGILALAFSPDGRHLALGSFDGSITLWDVLTEEQVALLGREEAPVFAVAFSPDGALVASGSAGRTTALWNARVEECGEPWRPLPSLPFAVSRRSEEQCRRGLPLGYDEAFAGSASAD